MTSLGSPMTAAAGGYDVVIGTVTGANLANYNLTRHNGTLTVNKIALSITAENKAKDYGDTFSAFTFTESGAVNGDTFVVPMTSAGSPMPAAAGGYDVVIGTVTGANLANYNLTPRSEERRVGKEGRSRTAEDKAKNNGDTCRRLHVNGSCAVKGR